jgi:prevent-host-death family protein
MVIASIDEVRERFAELLAMVEADETIVVTRDGKPVCDVRPHRKVDTSTDDAEG